MANEHSQIVPSMQPTAKVADFKFWCQKVLPLVYDDSLSYYEVLNKMVVYLNQVIDNINADIDNIAELEDDFLLLQEYVNNFFDDIDQLATYAERAEAAQTAAATSAINAASSASYAATSAVNAASSSLNAMDARDAAIAAKTAAESALANAQTAAINAAASATAAGNSADAASGSAINAAASAANALQNFQLSDAARTAAQSAASSAESDAESAADSATEAIDAAETAVNASGNIAKKIENVSIAHVEDALASIPKKLVIDIQPVQSGSGDPAPNNVRPITGWTGASVVRTGKNLFDLNEVNIGMNWDGNYGVPKRCCLYKKLPYGTYTVSVSNFQNFSEIGVGSVAEEYDRSGGERQDLVMHQLTAFTFHINQYSPYFYFFAINANDVTLADIQAIDFQLELGSTASEYEPYSGTTTLITFPSEAGTVYGGTLTNNGTDEWKLTVDSKLKTFTGEETWGKVSNQDRYYSQISDMVSGSFIPVKTNIFDVATYSHEITSGAFVKAGEGNNYIYVRDITQALPEITDVAALKTYLGTNNLQVYYPLAEPVTYTLTASQVLTLLNGINNVWANTGNINTLEYFTNAENYVTSQINLAKALIAPVLTEMKADTALVANDFRIVGNTLYRITGNIASGGTLTPNTNCVATTIGEILKSLLSA